MRNEQAVQARRLGAALPGLVLGVVAFAIMFASGARAEDPPIVSVGPVASGGNTASGSVGQGGKTTTCVNDEKSEANPSTSDPSGSAKLNQGGCQAAAGSSTATGTGGSTGSTSSTGAGGSTAGSGAKGSSASAAWVTAGKAAGLRIVRVRHLTKEVTVTKHFRVLATLRDTRGRLVRGAIVSVSRAPGAQSTISGVHATFSNKVGQATISVPVARHLLGKRLFLKIAARTPNARAVTLRSVRLPTLA